MRAEFSIAAERARLRESSTIEISEQGLEEEMARGMGEALARFYIGESRRKGLPLRYRGFVVKIVPSLFKDNARECGRRAGDALPGAGCGGMI